VGVRTLKNSGWRAVGVSDTHNFGLPCDLLFAWLYTPIKVILLCLQIRDNGIQNISVRIIHSFNIIRDKYDYTTSNF